MEREDRREDTKEDMRVIWREGEEREGWTNIMGRGGEIERGIEILKKLERDREKELEGSKRERDGRKIEGGGRERERDEGIER